MIKKYLFTATSRIGTREITPYGKFQITWDKEVSDFRRGYNKKYTKLTFCGEDFNWFYSLEKTTYRCEYIYLSIAKYCSGSYITDWNKGRISFNSGEWDLDQCKVTFEIEIVDDYSCYENSKTTKLNLLTYVVGTRQTIQLSSGTLEFYSCTRTYGSGGTVTEDPSPCPQP